jgi:hypothetical protein
LLISQERGLIYLAHPKTASKATRQLLEGLGFETPYDESLSPVVAGETPQGHHQGLMEHPGAGWRVFTAVRNHWDTWVSWYYFHGPKGLPFGPEWIELFLGRYVQYYPEPDRLWALHDTFADQIIRFERIEQDLASVLREPVTLPKVNLGDARLATKKKHYSEFYDEATRDYVAARWKDEIKRYGYSYQQEEEPCPYQRDCGLMSRTAR